MKCQKNKVCPKQPGDAPPLPSNAKLCTGCDNGKDKILKGDKKLKERFLTCDFPGCCVILREAEMGDVEEVTSNNKGEIIEIKHYCTKHLWWHNQTIKQKLDFLFNTINNILTD